MFLLLLLLLLVFGCEAKQIRGAQRAQWENLMGTCKQLGLPATSRYIQVLGCNGRHFQTLTGGFRYTLLTILVLQEFLTLLKCLEDIINRTRTGHQIVNNNQPSQFKSPTLSILFQCTPPCYTPCYTPPCYTPCYTPPCYTPCYTLPCYTALALIGF